MSLIDTSYFIGPLTIAQLGQPAVVNDVNLCINRNEPDFLQEVLGYDLWNDFMDGLGQSVIEQKWLDLRDGKAFKLSSNFAGYFPMWTYNNWLMNPQRTVKWVGFANQFSFSTNEQLGPEKFLTTDSGPNNPVSNTNVFTWSKLANAIYEIERRNFGTMQEGVDFAFSNNKQTFTLLKPGDKFNPGEIFVLHFSKLVNAGTPSDSGVSPIAGYVYCQYQRDFNSQMTGSGNVKVDAKNATSMNVSYKIIDAWNKMSKDLMNLWFFLATSGKDVYGSYDYTNINFIKYQPLNQFNL